MEVAKYETLRKSAEMSSERWQQTIPPIHIPVVLPSCRKLFAELDTKELTGLSSHRPDKLDGTEHVARHIDHIADAKVVVRRPSCRRMWLVTDKRIVGSLAVH